MTNCRPTLRLGSTAARLALTLAFVDRQNALWIGTQNEGIYRLSRRQGQPAASARWTRGDTVQDFFEDREGTLWVMTTRGIEAFRDLPVMSVTSREGLSADLANAVLARRDG